MKTISAEILLRQLEWRYAVQRFDTEKKISAEDWEMLEDALVLTPSSHGLQPWKFYVVTNPEIRERLKTFSWNQPQIVECSHLVVIAARKDLDRNDVEKYLDALSEFRGDAGINTERIREMLNRSIDSLRGEGRLDDWVARQTYIALGLLICAAAAIGVDSCPMEGFESQSYDVELGIADDGYFSVIACALGYRNEKEDKYAQLPKVRFNKTEVIKRI